MGKKHESGADGKRRESKQKRILGLLISAIAVLSVCLAAGLYLLARPLPEETADLLADSRNSAADSALASTEAGRADAEAEAAENASAASETESENETADMASAWAKAASDETIELVMVGDVLLHQRVLDSGLGSDGTYDFSHLFKNVDTTILSADLALVNQETVLGGEELCISEYPSFNSPQEIGDAETACGFDVILSATNHALDRGKDGILATTAYWETSHPDVVQLGMYDSREDSDSIYVYEQDGMRIAILNYTYGTNGISLPSSMPYAVNYLKESEVRSDIRRAHELADFVVVCPHWGTEYRLTADSSQENWCNIFLEEGVDLVIGTHPHVIEPIEIYEDQDGHQMLVYYSLGNFVCGTSSSGNGIANRMVGGMADVTIGRDENGEVSVLDYDIYPLVTHEAWGSDYTVYFLDDYTEELASENRIISQDPNFSKEYCENLVEEVWGE